MKGQAPDLLNADGSASMATALMMSHHAFRRDLAQFTIALRELDPGDKGRAAALKEEWNNYHGALHGHHEAEDQRMFPHLKQQSPQLVPVIDKLSQDHRRIDPLLDQGNQAFASLPEGAAAAAAVLAELSALLAPHLATEEAEVVPFLREAKGFPPPATEEEATMFVEGFAWSGQGVAPDILEKVFAMLPEALRARMPAARAAFEQRCQRAWGRVRSGASRTPIPDWLA